MMVVAKGGLEGESMLQLAVKVNDHVYSKPTSYWLHQLEQEPIDLTVDRRFEDPKVIRQRQRRRLRYKQTHCWVVRFMDWLSHFGKKTSESMLYC